MIKLSFFLCFQAIPVNSEQKAMHYAQTTDESVCCQIFPGMLQEENNAQFDISDGSFWGKPNPWQIIFDGYKSGIKPGKQVSQPFCLNKKGLAAELRNSLSLFPAVAFDMCAERICEVKSAGRAEGGGGCSSPFPWG